MKARLCYGEAVLSVRPEDLNSRNTIFGGTVMSLVDDIAWRVASRSAGVPVATASFDRITFEAPIHAYDRVALVAQGTRTFTTSMEVLVRVEGVNPVSGTRWKTSDALLTLVALGPDGRPTPFPALEPETPNEWELWRGAETRRALRLAAPKEPAPDYYAHDAVSSQHLSFEVTTEIAFPRDCNELGMARAGWILSLADRLAAISSGRHARQPVVTALVDSVHFLQPIFVGEIVVVRSYVTRAWHSSIEVRVEVWKRKHPAAVPERVTTAYFVFVAVDESGHPVAVPEVVLKTDLDRELFEAAGRRRELREAARRSLA